MHDGWRLRMARRNSWLCIWRHYLRLLVPWSRTIRGYLASKRLWRVDPKNSNWSLWGTSVSIRARIILTKVQNSRWLTLDVRVLQQKRILQKCDWRKNSLSLNTKFLEAKILRNYTRRIDSGDQRWADLQHVQPWRVLWLLDIGEGNLLARGQYFTPVLVLIQDDQKCFWISKRRAHIFGVYWWCHRPIPRSSNHLVFYSHPFV